MRQLSYPVSDNKIFNSLTNDKFLDCSKLKQIADDILKCIQNENDVTYRVKNIVRKGEIACYKQFLLFSQCFPQLFILNKCENPTHIF